jgi:hypothetical protein
MKRLILAFVLCACVCAWFVTDNVSAQTTTQTVVVGFEEPNPLEGYNGGGCVCEECECEDCDCNIPSRPGEDDYWTWGFPPNDDCDNVGEFYDEYYNELVQITYTSQGATFRVNYGYDEMTGWEIWSGIGLSTRTTKATGEWWQNGNDALSTTGTGNCNSETYAVVYGTSWQYINEDWESEILPTITLPENASLQSIAIANLQYTVDSMTNGDQFTPPLEPNGSFDLIIYGIGKNEDDEIDCLVSKKVPLFGLDGWTTVTFGAGWEEVTELRFAFDGTSVNMNIGALNNPVYFAFDDLTFTLPITSP